MCVVVGGREYRTQFSTNGNTNCFSYHRLYYDHIHTKGAKIHREIIPSVPSTSTTIIKLPVFGRDACKGENETIVHS